MVFLIVNGIIRRLRAIIGRERLSATVLVFGCLAHWIIARVFPFERREPSLWVFGTRSRGAFVGNAKYLYLYTVTHHPEIRPVWLAKDRTVLRDLQQNGYEAYHIYSPRGIWLNLRAGVVIVTHGLRDINLSCSGGARAVLLWHGTPLKRISWDAAFREEPWPIQAAHRYAHRVLDLLTAETEAAKASFVSGLGVDPDTIVFTGYPRNDVLTRQISGADIGTDRQAVREIRDLDDSVPVLLYVPTFRDHGGEPALEQLDLASLECFLRRIDGYCYLKGHPDEPSVNVGNYSRIRLVNSGADIYPLLADVDLLITDYSSIYFDFLPLDRPIIFFAYDLERYRAERGFYYDYEAITPGPKVRNIEELTAQVAHELDDDTVARERRVLCEQFCQTNESRSEAVYESILNTIVDDEC